MKILIAPDSFKDALSAPEACIAIQRGIQNADPTIESKCFPMGDGGEGTAEILHFHSGGTWIEMVVLDPLFRPLNARYGLSKNGKTAFIEMATASGLQLLLPEERNCKLTTTYGTGEMILDAYQKGARHIILAIGGSASNDAGTGMATAIGYRFLDKFGETLPPIGANLHLIRRIILNHLQIELNDLKLEVVCDVQNPLYGPNGAAYTYAAQKGATPKDIEALDAGLRHLATLIFQELGKEVASVKGAGAAGGLGAGAIAFLNAELKPGIAFVMQHTNFEAELKTANLVITGEGKIDSQTLHGKLIHGICQKAKKFNVPVIALCGILEATPEQIQHIGLQAAFSVLNKPISLNEAINSTKSGLEQTAFHLVRTINLR